MTARDAVIAVVLVVVGFFGLVGLQELTSVQVAGSLVLVVFGGAVLWVARELRAVSPAARGLVVTALLVWLVLALVLLWLGPLLLAAVWVWWFALVVTFIPERLRRPGLRLWSTFALTLGAMLAWMLGRSVVIAVVVRQPMARSTASSVFQLVEAGSLLSVGLGWLVAVVVVQLAIGRWFRWRDDEIVKDG